MLSTTTPALLFPAISLLLLAYTNRFLVLAQLIRQLNREQRDGQMMRNSEKHQKQVQFLNQRIGYIKNMQALGIASFIVCTACMFVLFVGAPRVGAALFGISLILLVISLLYALVEVLASTRALSVELAPELPSADVATTPAPLVQNEIDINPPSASDKPD